MIFSSTLFIFGFLPITLLIYFILRGNARNYWLLAVSLIFFSWSQINYLWIILLNIVVNYSAAMVIDRVKKCKKILLGLSLLINIGLLFYFKYFDFTISTINNLFKQNIELQNIVLPIGISFFTFQGISYVIDVFRGDVPSQKNPFKVALYITLFPQLIAGPIVRYTDIAEEIDRRNVSIDLFTSGVERFIIGLGKKAIIANTMAVLVDNVWNQGVSANTVSITWIASIAYTLQIYFDFSGYSDMAIGLGRMFGFHFNENFNLPYISKDITEFWRRWHISLSSWFRDYVYIPLGGNRKRVYFNLAVVFLLTGIWHGASWHFIAWGVWNGVFILIERFIKSYKKHKGKNKVTNTGTDIIKKLYTLFIVNIGWVIFRAPSLGEAWIFIKGMFGLLDNSMAGFSVMWFLDRWTITILLVGIIFSSSIPSKIGKIITERYDKKIVLSVRYLSLLLLFALVIIRIVSGTYNPFIYFQF